MAVRMDIIGALLVLFRHGYLVVREPVQRKREYKVYKNPPGNVPARCVGYITEKQFEQLARRSLLRQINQKESRDSIYTYFELDTARAEAEYGGQTGERGRRCVCVCVCGRNPVITKHKSRYLVACPAALECSMRGQWKTNEQAAIKSWNETVQSAKYEKGGQHG